jgi:hypothetical protein
MEKDRWYWVTSTEEPDIFYPVLCIDKDTVFMDGKRYDMSAIKGLNFYEAAMPEVG